MSGTLFCSHCELSYPEDEGTRCPECGCFPGFADEDMFDGCSDE